MTPWERIKPPAREHLLKEVLGIDYMPKEISVVDRITHYTGKNIGDIMSAQKNQTYGAQEAARDKLKEDKKALRTKLSKLKKKNTLAETRAINKHDANSTQPSTAGSSLVPSRANSQKRPRSDTSSDSDSSDDNSDNHASTNTKGKEPVRPRKKLQVGDNTSVGQVLVPATPTPPANSSANNKGKQPVRPRQKFPAGNKSITQVPEPSPIQSTSSHTDSNVNEGEHLSESSEALIW